MKNIPLRSKKTSIDSVKKITTVAAGVAPSKIAVNSVTGRVYVANMGSNNVTVIDGDDTVSTIAVQDTPTDIVVNEVTGITYVMNSNSNSISAIFKNGATENIPTWTDEYGTMAINSKTSKLYSVSWGHSGVSVIDLDFSNNYINTIPVDFSRVMAMGVNTKTNRIYVASTDSDSVLMIDGTNNATTTIQVGDYPQSVVVNSETNRIYIGNQLANTVTAIDGSDNSIIGTIGGLGTVAVCDVRTNRIYGKSHQRPPGRYGNIPDKFFVINGADNSTAQIDLDDHFFDEHAVVDIASNYEADKIYATIAGNQRSVVVINAQTNAVAATIPIGHGSDMSSGLAVNPATNKIYVSHRSSNTVTIIEEHP